MGLEKQTDYFLPCLFLHSSCPSFQWNPHAQLPLFQEVHHLYFFLLRFMLAVAIYLVCETPVFLVTHYGSSFVEFLGGSPLEPVPFDLQYLWIWTFLPHLWQVTFDLTDDLPTEPLPFTLRQILKSSFFKALLNNFPMATVYAFISEGWYWDFSLPLAGYQHFESKILWYSLLASCTRES